MTDIIKWEQLLRFRLIEIIVLWEGRLTTKHISSMFKIGRQQASRDIACYQAQFNNAPLILDYAIKGYRPTEYFKPKFTRGTANEYLTLLHQQEELLAEQSPLTFGFAESVMLNVPERKMSPIIVRGLIKAAREQRWVEIDYVSFNNSKPKKRKIIPHTIVNNGYRWHVRAYTESDDYSGFRDFVLSRFKGEPSVLEKSEIGRKEDNDWNSIATEIVVPNPNLNEQQQSIVANDYGMTNNKLVIRTKAALMRYTLIRLGVCFDSSLLKNNPVQYQLAVI